MKCPRCQVENINERKFCRECGFKLVFACNDCGFENLPGDKYCGECGHELGQTQKPHLFDYDRPQSYTPKHLAERILSGRSAIEGERKSVTVLFADVANFSSISEKLDPEEIHQIMDGCFRILLDEIHHFNGTINQFTGDGVMALFGAPLAHEEHAKQACYSALSIQIYLAKYNYELRERLNIDFKMRIGLNSGPVVVGSIGDDLRMDYTAIGDTTNLAARMESLARPGTIFLSANTHKLVKPYFKFEPLGKLEVKGKENLQETYELVSAEGAGTRLEAAAAKGLTKFIGRSHEIHLLKGYYAKAKSGAGQIVGIVGEPGVGKSRLLLELRNALPIGEYTFLEGRCVQYASTMAYLPFLQILKQYFEIYDEDQELQIKHKLERKLTNFDEHLKKHISAFHGLFSLKIDNEKFLHLSPLQKQIKTFEAIRDILVRESQNKPIILAVEDLHWIDKTSQELLDYLVEWLSNSYILMAILYRPEYTHQWSSKSYYNKIGVSQLSMETSAELVQSILEGGEVVPELSELIFKRAGGNPLYVEEITCNLLDNGTIKKKNDKFILIQNPSEIQIPDTIQDIIAARIDRLEENLKRIMQVASVIGREFAYRILQSIVEMREDLKSQLLSLQGLEFISEKALFPELEYIFKHALTQEVAYNSLLKKQRKRIHEKIGTAIEDLYPEKLEDYCELLAYHFGQSDDKNKCWGYLYRANQKAAKLNAVIDAKAYFDQAMQLLNELLDIEENRKRRLNLLIHNIDVFELLFNYTEYYEYLERYEKIVYILNQPEMINAYTTRLAICEWWFGKNDKAIQRLNKSIESYYANSSSKNAGFAYVCLQWCYSDVAEHDKVIATKKYALHHIEKNFHLRYHIYALTAVSHAYRNMGCWDDAMAEGNKALQVAEEYSDDSLISFAAWMLSFVYVHKNDFSLAEKYGQYAVDKAPTPADKAWTPTALAIVWCRTGKFNKGIEILSSISETYKAVNWVIGVAWTKAFIGEGYWLAGKYDNAMEALEEAVESSQKSGARYYLAFAYRIFGEVTRLTDPDQSFNYFKKCISLNKEIKAENELALAYAGYGRLYKQQGNTEKAMEYLIEAKKILDRLGTLIEPEKIRKDLEELS